MSKTKPNDIPEEGVFNFEELIAEENKDVHDDLDTDTDTDVDDDKDVDVDKDTDVDTDDDKDTDTDDDADTDTDVDPDQDKDVDTDQDKTGFALRAKTYLENGRWEDANILLGEEEIAISALTEIDEELFFQIDEAQEKRRTKVLEEKYINKDDLDETTQKLNEISLAGGDITELIRAYDKYVHPLEGLDLESEQVQEAIVRQDLTQLNIDESIIDLTIEKYKKDLVLTEKAKTIVDNINNAFNKVLDEKQKEATNEKQAQIKKQQDFRENLTSAYKENKIEDKEIKKLVAFATGVDSQGNKEIQKEFDKLLEDPKTAMDLIFYLYNTESFLKFKGAKQDRKQKLETLELMNLSGQQKNKKQTNKKSKDTDTSGFTFVEQS